MFVVGRVGLTASSLQRSALLTDVGWLPFAFMFSHLVLILVGLWAAQDKSGLEPVFGVSYPDLGTVNSELV